MTAGFFLAMGTGALGGFGHCLGMCGPVVATHALGRSSLRQALYHLGRLITYSALGAIAGGLGSVVGLAARIEGIQNALMSLVGVAMVWVGFGIWRGRSPAGSFLEARAHLVLGRARTIMQLPAGLSSLFFGLLMGFMPCGLVYTMLIGASGAGSAEAGAWLMLGFGLGTTPGLMAFGMTVSSLSGHMRARLLKAGGVVVAALGVYYLYKGIGFHAAL